MPRRDLATMFDPMVPDGERLTSSQLPPEGLKRWSSRHKLLVVAAVRHGLLTFREACARYNLSLEEYLDWQRSYEEVCARRE